MVKYLLPKLLYVCLYGVLGSAIPYLSLFYSDSLHLSSQQIGIILAIAPFIQSVACPFWTLQVDKRPHFHGPLMALLMLIGGLSVIALMFIPVILPNDTTSATLFSTIVLAISFAFFGQPVTVLVDSAVLKILGEYKIYYGDQRLWGSISNGVCILLVGYFIGLFGINCAFYIFGVSVCGFISIALFTRVVPAVTSEEERDPLLTSTTTQQKKGHYNYPPDQDHINDVPAEILSENPDFLQTAENIRRYSSTTSSHANTLLIGDENNSLSLYRTATSLAARSVQDEANLLLDQIEDQHHLPPLGLALSHIPTIDTSLAAFASIGQQPHEDIVAEEENLKNTIFASPKVWTFLLMTLFFGVHYSMVAQFLFLFLKQDLELDASVIGWTGPIGGITEVSTFYVSRLLLKNFSVASLVTCAHMAIIIRNLAYKMLEPNTAYTMAIALLLQLVNGFSYALIWSTCVSEVDQMFPIHQRAIAQGILAALFSGLGFGIGCIVGGYAYDHYGILMLFNVAIGVAAISLLVFWAGRMFKSPSSVAL